MIVADASPLIALSRIGQLELCRLLFQTVAIPVAVNQEIVPHARGFEGPRPDWIVVQTAEDAALVRRLRRELDEGEAEAIALALQLQVPLLIDEMAGRRLATVNGLTVTGTLGVLLAAKRAGHVQRLDELFRRLQEEGFRMSPSLMAELLRAAGESDP